MTGDDMDSLRRLVRERDAQRNTPRQMQVTERSVEAKRICIQCRAVDDPYWHHTAWFKRMEQLPEQERTPYAPKSPCRDCGGQLVEVVW